MNPEQPKQYTPEEIAEMEKSRTISDAELLKGGAKYIVEEDGEKKTLDISMVPEKDRPYELRGADYIKMLEERERIFIEERLPEKIDDILSNYNEKTKTLDTSIQLDGTIAHIVISQEPDGTYNESFSSENPKEGKFMNGGWSAGGNKEPAFTPDAVRGYLKNMLARAKLTRGLRGGL